MHKGWKFLFYKRFSFLDYLTAYEKLTFAPTNKDNTSV